MPSLKMRLTFELKSRLKQFFSNNKCQLSFNFSKHTYAVLKHACEKATRTKVAILIPADSYGSILSYRDTARYYFRRNENYSILEKINRGPNIVPPFPLFAKIL